MSEHLADLQSQIATLLRAYTRAADADRTEVLREMSERVVDLRALFTNSDGASDWRGSSYAYRQALAEAYGMAGLPRDDVQTVQAAMRYHVGNILRERLDEDTLTSIGLRPVSPRERSVEKRETESAILAAFKGRALEGLPPLKALSSAKALAAGVESDAVRALTREERIVVRELVSGLRREVDRLAKAAGTRRPPA